MQTRDAAYYESRAARERELAGHAPDWYVHHHIETAERFERLADRLRNPQPVFPRRLLPLQRRGLA